MSIGEQPQVDEKTYRVLALGTAKHLEQIVQGCLIAGHEVIPVSSIHDAMECLDGDSPIDLVVSETHLESESVFDLLKAVKSKKRYDHVRFMMLCTNASDLARFASQSIQSAANMLGADKYLIMNDFDVKRLAKEIDALMPIPG